MKNQMKLFGFFLVFLCMMFVVQEVFAQFSSIEEENMIVITKSQEMSKVIFDGKWSFKTEWKESSWKLVQANESTVFHLRAAHQGNFIYFHLNVTPDTKADFDIDKSIICIDTKNNKSEFKEILDSMNVKDSNMDLIDKSILYFALNEMIYGELDKPVIIDESLRLSKKFSSPESYKFINANLDKYLKLN